jgi:hypothetical protein
MPIDNPQNEQMWDGFANAEVHRVEKIRKEQGDDAWAQVLGSTIVAQLTLMHIERQPNDGYLAEQGRRTIHGRGAAAGMIEELASRRYIPVDVDELIDARWKREGRRNSS